MILTDASAIISIVDKGQGENHKKCAGFLRESNEIFITTLPCLTETMYFLGKIANWNGQNAIWSFIEKLPLRIFHLEAQNLLRMRLLMEKYQDTPMDFADASLVAAAEGLGTNKIFSLDTDFYVYRINDSESFEVIP